MKRKLLFLLTLLPLMSIAQTTLIAGDIAIIHNQTDTPDDFAFVTFVDLQAGTEIVFTDCGADAAGFNTPCTEGAFKYTVPGGGHLAGDIIKFEGTGAVTTPGNPNFTTYNDSRITGSFATSTSGDQIIAYQGATADSPTFIFASNTASTVFTGAKTDTNQTGLPTGLDDTTPPRTALGLGSGTGTQDEWDNVVYNGTFDFSGSSLAAAKLALTDPANYYMTNDVNDATYTGLVAAIPNSLMLPLATQDFTLNRAITIYPIPSKDGIINITNNNSEVTLSTIEIFDITGKKIYNQKLNNNLQQQINLNNANSGIYFAKITDNDNNTITKKLIVQ